MGTDPRRGQQESGHVPGLDGQERVEPDDQARLFSPGERLGWEFRDRLRHWRPFPEPEPRPGEPEAGLVERAQRASERRKGAMGWAFAGAAPALLGGAYLVGFFGPTVPLFSPVTALALLALLVSLWLIVWRPVRLSRLEHEALHAVTLARSDLDVRHREASMARERRSAAYNAAEWERVDRIPEWGAVRTPAEARRIDLFGGSLAGWEGFLTTFGASAVATGGPVRMLDLSEARVAEELTRLTAARGVEVAVQVLPRDLASSDLLAGLGAGRLADVLVESIHGDRPDADREARAVDARILGAVCRAVEPGLTLARVHAQLESILAGEPAGVFPADYVRLTHDRFRALEAHLHPLRELGSGSPRPVPAGVRLECMIVGDEGDVVTTDLFADLATQWALRGLRGAAGGDGPRLLVVAGADRLRRRHLERLADACERHGVRLLSLFRHLREEAADVLGSADATVFMRLGNHAEAERAARFIGLGHRFALSQVTSGQGGHRDWGQEESRSESRATTAATGRYGWARTRERTWGVARSYAEGTSWHRAETHQRVLEYTVEPTALQNLPEYALLLVQRGPIDPSPGGQALAGRPQLQVADCNPDIVTLPRVLTAPLPVELPAPPTPSPTSGEGEGGAL